MSSSDSYYNPDSDDNLSESKELHEFKKKLKFHEVLKRKRDPTKKEVDYVEMSESDYEQESDEESWSGSDDSVELSESESKSEKLQKVGKKPTKSKTESLTKSKENRSARKSVVAKPKKEKQVKEIKPKVIKEKKIKSEKKKKVMKPLLDPDFNLNKAYFFQTLDKENESRIITFLLQAIETSFETADINSYLSNFPVLRKGYKNVTRIKDGIAEGYSKMPFKQNTTLNYIKMIDIITNMFYEYKPVVRQWYFFPNVHNEVHIANMIRTCKKTLDIAIFTFTNNSISAAVKEAFERGVKVRLIADDEQAKALGSDVCVLASLGVPTKTDNAKYFHMHHKFAVLDQAVLLTGSFNYTAQAVKFNQENILFLENKEMAEAYTKEFNRLWNLFEISISKEEGDRMLMEQTKMMENMQEKRKAKMNAKKVEKALKKNVVVNSMAANLSEKDNIQTDKCLLF